MFAIFNDLDFILENSCLFNISHLHAREYSASRMTT